MAESRLFLDGIFEANGSGNNSPSAVYITMPNYSGKTRQGATSLTGLMVGDPTWTASTKWGPIINDVSNLQDISSLMGTESMFSWISASTMCWKGTSPLSISIDFYLINYSKNLGLEDKLRSFVKLASLYKDPDATMGADYKVLVHGGYAADLMAGNRKLFDNIDNVRSFVDLTKTELGQLGDKFDQQSQLYDEGGNAKGSLTIQFGHKSTIRNLLLSKVNVTESTVEVADQNGGSIKPLYYRVSAQFTGVKPLLTVDVDRMFKG